MLQPPQLSFFLSLLKKKKINLFLHFFLLPPNNLVTLSVQHECIPQAILGTDVICQAKSGMGKTAVFVLATLQQLDINAKTPQAIVLCHTRELAYQIRHEFDRFKKYMPTVNTEVFYGGVPVEGHRKILKSDKVLHIVIGTPGRILQLAEEQSLNMKGIKFFILDECDKMLESLGKNLFSYSSCLTFFSL